MNVFESLKEKELPFCRFHNLSSERTTPFSSIPFYRCNFHFITENVLVICNWFGFTFLCTLYEDAV